VINKRTIHWTKIGRVQNKLGYICEILNQALVRRQRGHGRSHNSVRNGQASAVRVGFHAP
jgi:hypothetical protein